MGPGPRRTGRAVGPTSSRRATWSKSRSKGRRGRAISSGTTSTRSTRRGPRPRRRRPARQGGARRRLPRATGSLRLGSRPPALALRLRLRLGGLRAGEQASLGVLRPAAVVRGSAIGRIEPRADRAAGALRIIDIWWEDAIDPLDLEGFVDAFVAALRHTRGSSAPGASAGRGPRAIARWGRPSGRRPGTPDRVARSGPDLTVFQFPQLPACPSPGHGTPRCWPGPCPRRRGRRATCRSRTTRHR